jgi:hypothetical protein
MMSPKPPMSPVRLVFIAVLLHTSPVLSEESSGGVALPIGDAWGSVEPLLEYRSLPTIEWLSVLPDGSIGEVWVRGESGEQPSCAHKQAEGSGAAIGHNGMKC